MATIHRVYWVEISKNPIAPFIVRIFVTLQRFIHRCSLEIFCKLCVYVNLQLCCEGSGSN